MKKFHPFEIALVVVIFAIHGYAAFSDAYNFPNTWFTRDDAYYYFKVAQNITEGRGSTFDGINPTNGYHPLWMIICIPVFFLARFDLILPLRVLLLLIAGIHSATAILIYRLLKENLSQAVAMLAAAFWAFDTYIHYVVYEFGLESPLVALTLVLFLYILSHYKFPQKTDPIPFRELTPLGLMAAVVMFSRLDLIFLAGITGVWIIFRNTSIRSLLPLDVVIIFFSFTLSVAFRSGVKTYNEVYAQAAILSSALAILVKLPALYFSGSYQHTACASAGKTILSTVFALAMGSAILSTIILLSRYLGFDLTIPRSALALDLIISLVLMTLLRMAAIWFNGKPAGGLQPSSLPPREEFRTNWRRWLTEGRTYYGILLGALSIYMLINKALFDTFLPVSGQIKRWWGLIGTTVYDYPARNWREFLGIGYGGVYNAWQPIFRFLDWVAVKMKPLYPGSNTQDERYYITLACFFFIAGVILFINRSHTREKISKIPLTPLIAGACLHILIYTTSSYGGAKEWYWISQILLLVLILSVLIDGVISPLHKILPLRVILTAGPVVISFYLASILSRQIITVMRYHYFPPDRPYMEVLPFLEENTPPGSVIGMTGGGNVGYFLHDRIIVNMDGLINSYAYFEALKNGEAATYLRERGMNIVFANGSLLRLPPYDGQFSRFLASYNTYGGKSLFYLLEKPKY